MVGPPLSGGLDRGLSDQEERDRPEGGSKQTARERGFQEGVVGFRRESESLSYVKGNAAAAK